MTACTHTNLLLLSPPKTRVRCRHCHLTIDPKELGNDYCPECYESLGQKRYNFETIDDGKADVIRYRCEDCGIIIES